MKKDHQKKPPKKLLIPIKDKPRPFLPEGFYEMTCIGCNVNVNTRFGFKSYLYWEHVRSGQVLEQYFNHPEEGYPRHGKAVQNYLIAMDKNAHELASTQDIDLHEIVGLRAKVAVETVRRKYSSGNLKGQSMPSNLNYSKVSEILEPLGWTQASRKEKHSRELLLLFISTITFLSATGTSSLHEFFFSLLFTCDLLPAPAPDYELS